MKTESKKLGKGLSDLLGESFINFNQLNEKEDYLIDIEKIEPNNFQPRRIFNENNLRELADSIIKNGVLQPIIVRELEGKYQIIAGERRWRASKIANLTKIPVIIKSLSDKEAIEIALIENVQRQDLSLLEEAEGYQKLINEFGYTQEQISESIGKSRSHISNMIRVLGLSPFIKNLISSNQISFGHAKVLLSSEDPDSMARNIIENNLSVRQLENNIKDSKNKKSPIKNNEKYIDNNDEDLKNLEISLSLNLGMKVIITHNNQGGNIMIQFNNIKDLDKLIKKLGN